MGIPDTVVLMRDIPDAGLQKGDVGAIVHKYATGGAFEVEFVAADGQTLAVMTLTDRDVRLMRGHEILHVRDLAHSDG